MTPKPQDARPVQLHVIHDLGGGSAKWVEDFASADHERANLVLRPFTHDRAMAWGVALFVAGADRPLKSWSFTTPIVATVIAHAEYRRALEEIRRGYRVEVMIVSSLIGHSLEALDTGLPTLVVNHDYYPYCPAINIHFNGICRTCDDRRIAECHAGNPRFNPFVDFLPPDRIDGAFGRGPPARARCATARRAARRQPSRPTGRATARNRRSASTSRRRR